jgi:hypothetical protein
VKNPAVVPARAEPLIGPAEGRTRWLGRDDAGYFVNSANAPFQSGGGGLF